MAVADSSPSRGMLHLLMVLSAACVVCAADLRPPNIVLILADDMGVDSVSANNQAMGPLKTPHVDRLIDEGMNFTDAHSGSAVCTPTRYGLLTGRYCWRTPLKKSVLWSYGRPLIEKDRLTVAELLKQHGYTTGMVGKWHLGFDWRDAEGKLANDKLQLGDALFKKGAPRQRVLECAGRIDFSKTLTGGPTDHGFDHYFGVDVPNFPPYSWIARDRLVALPTTPKPEGMYGQEGPMVPGWKLEEILPTLGNKSAEWIAERARLEERFFLYLPLTSPHTPIAPSKPYQGVSVTPYADFIVETDAVVGQVMKAIREAGVEEQTLVIFTADNGTSPACGFDQLKQHGVDLKKHYKGHKAQIHEGGHRVPFVVRWPGVVPPGTENRSLICLNDFMATVANILQHPLAEDSAEDSVSILPLFRDPGAILKERPMVVHHDYGGGFAIRNQRWKLVGDKLFDMTADPKETTDVSAQHPAVVRRMASTLRQYRDSGRSRTASTPPSG